MKRQDKIEKLNRILSGEPVSILDDRIELFILQNEQYILNRTGKIYSESEFQQLPKGNDIIIYVIPTEL